MKYFTACLLLLLTATLHSEEKPIVKMQTSLGTMILELNLNKAPKTVENFIRYAQEGFYDGTLFHRVIRGFVIQGGGYTQDYEKKFPLYDPIPNESNNGLENLRGTIAMARQAYDADSATSQFFINVKNNDSLNYKSSVYSDDGYAVFGKIIEGINVVDKIQRLKTTTKMSLRNVPRIPVILEKVTVTNVPTKPKEETSPVIAETVTDTLSNEETEIETQVAKPKPSILSDSLVPDEIPSVTTPENSSTETEEIQPTKAEEIETKLTEIQATKAEIERKIQAIKPKTPVLPIAVSEAEPEMETQTIKSKNQVSPPAVSVTETEPETEIQAITSVSSTETGEEPIFTTTAETEDFSLNAPEKVSSEKVSEKVPSDTTDTPNTRLYPPDQPSQPDQPELLPD